MIMPGSMTASKDKSKSETEDRWGETRAVGFRAYLLLTLSNLYTRSRKEIGRQHSELVCSPFCLSLPNLLPIFKISNLFVKVA